MDHRRTHAAARTAAALVALAAAAPLAAQEAATTVSGEVRLRNEAARPVAADQWDSFTLLRTRVGLLATLNANLKAFVQLQDSRAFGDQPTTLSGTANQIDLHQGYIELGGTLGATPLALRAGRQEIALGNERLVGAVGWSNTGRSFDAARLDLGRSAAWKGTAFFATVHESDPRFRAPNVQHLERDHWFGGVFVAHRLAEAYALWDNNAHFGAFTDVDRGTLGGRLQAPADSRLLASLEGAYQLGAQTVGAATGSPLRQDIRAWFAGGRVGVRTGAAALPSVGLGFDYLSGDDRPTADRYSAFNTLYATNHRYYGYMDLFLDPAAATGQRGLVDAMVNVRTGLGRLGTLEVDVHRFALANTAGLDASEIGWELDLTYPFQVAGAGRFMVGYSVFRNGEAAPSVNFGPDGKLRHWGFVQAAVPF